MLASAKEMRELRDAYYAQNKDMFLKELAQGAGEHLTVMSFFGRCPTDQQDKFNAHLQKNYAKLIQKVEDDKKFMDLLDSYLGQELNCNLGV